METEDIGEVVFQHTLQLFIMPDEVAEYSQIVECDCNFLIDINDAFDTIRPCCRYHENKLNGALYALINWKILDENQEAYPNECDCFTNVQEY